MDKTVMFLFMYIYIYLSIAGVQASLRRGSQCFIQEGGTGIPLQ